MQLSFIEMITLGSHFFRTRRRRCANSFSIFLGPLCLAALIRLSIFLGPLRRSLSTASSAIGTMADTGGFPFLPGPLASSALSPSILSPWAHHLSPSIRTPRPSLLAAGAETIPSFDSSHINEALADPAFVQAVKAAKEKQQLQQLDGIVETKKSDTKASKAQPKYGLDPKLPKVHTLCIPIRHRRRRLFILSFVGGGRSVIVALPSCPRRYYHCAVFFIRRNNAPPMERS